ncbi:MAG TPA: hypothetical protein VM198_07065 [Longimicrobiales bacterium]|nr:hypothetical protein [Longimicrobiales bacterium]
MIVLTPLAGCDIPTELPILDTRWVVPAEETRFGVAELLPGSVTLTPDEGAFIVDFDPVTFAETLGALCPLCAASDGLTVQKPPFLGEFESSVDFPSEVSSISILSGDIVLEIDNGLNFDPLRPAPGVTGTLVITVTDDADGDVLGMLEIDGTTTALPAGGTLTRTIELATATVEGSIVATAEIDSPLGDPVTIDSSLPVTVTVTPTNILVASVTIVVAGRSVDFDPVSLDVEEVDQNLIDRILAGGFIVDVVNPFGVAADFQLTIDGPTIAPIQKSASVGTAGTSTIEISFTTGELRAFLGQPGVTLSGGAVVDAEASQITVLPGQELVLTGKLDLTLRIGG